MYCHASGCYCCAWRHSCAWYDPKPPCYTPVWKPMPYITQPILPKPVKIIEREKIIIRENVHSSPDKKRLGW
jgi:hypothetical protein